MSLTGNIPLSKRLIIVCSLMILVCFSFWTLSRYPDLGGKAAMSGFTTIEDTLTHEALIAIDINASLLHKMTYSAINWLFANWRGMSFGIILASLILTLLRYLPQNQSKNKITALLQGTMTGTPLGVCVNCVAPIAKSIYDSGRKPETALAVLFSSPNFNIIVLAMVLAAFPFYMFLLKIIATLTLIFLIVPLVTWRYSPGSIDNSLCETPASLTKESWLVALRLSINDILLNFRYIVIRTVPLMFLAALLGSSLSHVINLDMVTQLEENIVTLLVLAFIGTFLPLPIAFDIMLVHSMMLAGLPISYAATLLITLGSFSIYSAMIVTQTFSLRIAITLFLSVVIIGTITGYVAPLFEQYRAKDLLLSYETAKTTSNTSNTSSNINPLASSKITTIEFELIPQTQYNEIYADNQVTATQIPYTPRSKGEALFSVINASDIGIGFIQGIRPDLWFEPLIHGRGLAAGDLNNDGYEDIILATNNGFQIYQNQQGKNFKPIKLDIAPLNGSIGIVVAFVDMNNDGLLDIYCATFNNGNHILMSLADETSSGRHHHKLSYKHIQLPDNEEIITNATAFADLNHDGFIDIIQGTFSLGYLTAGTNPLNQNYLLMNKAGASFDTVLLNDNRGQTNSILVHDINKDGHLDILTANDFDVADDLLIGNGDGMFMQSNNANALLPQTAHFGMSIDSLEFNNGNNAIYFAGIGFKDYSETNFPEVHYKAIRQKGIKACRDGITQLTEDECLNFVKLIEELYAFNPHSKRCETFKESPYYKSCLAMKVAHSGMRLQAEGVCNDLIKDYPLTHKACLSYINFYQMKKKSNNTKTINLKSIPQQKLGSILLSDTNKNSTYNDISASANIVTSEWAWNATFADIDNDGWEDLYISNGTLNLPLFTENIFYHNQQNNHFVAKQNEFNLNYTDLSSSHIYIDFDNDGDTDILSNSLYGTYRLFRNDITENNSISFVIYKENQNKHCIGCRIEIYSDDKKYSKRIRLDGGYHSYQSNRLIFGIGDAEIIDKIIITEPNGNHIVINALFEHGNRYNITF